MSGGAFSFFNTLRCQGVRFLFQHPEVSGGAEKTSPAFLPFFEGHFSFPGEKNVTSKALRERFTFWGVRG